MNQNQNPTEETPIQQPGLDDFFFHAADYIYRRKKLFINLGIVLFVVILAIYGGFEYKAAQDKSRAEAYYKLNRLMAQPEFVEQNMGQLDQFILDHAGTKEAFTALLQRSNLYYIKGDLQKSEHDLLSLLQNLPPESALYPLSALYLSNTLRDQGKLNEAVGILIEAKGKNPSDVILIELAETYFALKNFPEAKNILNLLQGQYPDSLFLDRAKRLNEAM